MSLTSKVFSAPQGQHPNFRGFEPRQELIQISNIQEIGSVTPLEYSLNIPLRRVYIRARIRICEKDKGQDSARSELSARVFLAMASYSNHWTD